MDKTGLPASVWCVYVYDFTMFMNGAPDKIRTCDPYHVKVIL